MSTSKTSITVRGRTVDDVIAIHCDHSSCERIITVSTSRASTKTEARKVATEFHGRRCYPGTASQPWKDICDKHEART